MSVSVDAINVTEDVARILHREWVVEGELQINAFALRSNETYLSVNRTSVESYSQDIEDFISKHLDYRLSDNSAKYRQAIIPVAKIQNLSISFKNWIAKLSVEIEPRSTHYSSHAGIFTRVNGQNVKGGQQNETFSNSGQKVSYGEILLKVQLSFLQLARLETCELKPAEE